MGCKSVSGDFATVLRDAFRESAKPATRVFGAMGFVIGLAIASAAPAAAYAVPAAYVPGDTVGSYNSDVKHGPFPETFNDTYSFSILSSADVSVSLSSTPFSYLTLTDLGIFNANTHAELTTFTQGVQSNALGAGTNTVFLDTGSYYIGVSGSFSTAGLYNGVLSVASVPLPSTVALFGLSILGLGAFGAIRRTSVNDGSKAA